MVVYGLTLLIGLSALLAVRAAYAAWRGWFYLFKPLTTTLILLLALLAPSASPALYQAAIVAGLAFSLAGDILLMLSAKRFFWGIACFLMTQLCYSAAFTLHSGFREPAWLGLPFAVIAIGLIGQIAPRARSLRWPTAAYSLLLTVMVWRACALWAVAGDPPARLGGLGALLFVVSDTTLAVNRFIRRFPAAQVLVLSTYYAAQCLIAWSA